MTKEEALKHFAEFGAAWFGNSKQHFAFSAYDRLNGWNKLADKWKEEAVALLFIWLNENVPQEKA